MHNIKVSEGEFLYNRSLVICRKIQTALPYDIFFSNDPLHFSFPVLLLDIALVVTISRIIRFILKPLRQPRVVSQVLGGIIVGSSALGKNKRFRSYLFSDYADYMYKNFGILGLVYFVFVSGVKTDLLTVAKVGRKTWAIATICICIPIICTLFVAIPLRHMMEEEIAKPITIWAFSTTFGLTAFTTIHPIVKELNLFSSEIGRLALTTAVLTDFIGIQTIFVFEAAKQEEVAYLAALWYFISLIAMMVLIFGGFRMAMLWIIKTTPVGKPVDQIYVIAILLSVLIAGFLADISGFAIAGGSMCIGLAIPEGPPLGATIIEKTETFTMDILMPFTFLFVGLLVDLSSLHDKWAFLVPVFLMILIGYFTKFIATVLACQFFKMPLKESMALSLMLSLRGEVEIMLFLHWMDLQIITIPYFTLFVLTNTAATAICTPLIGMFYDPTRPYTVNKRRDIQHNQPNTELKIVACIHNEKHVTGIVNLFDVSNPTMSNPFRIYALQVIDIVARANPVFIEHENEEGLETEEFSYSSIHRAWKLFEEARSDYISVHLYTSITFRGSMYQDICELALVKKASLVIVAHDGETTVNRDGVRKRVQSVNANVLKHAPCSVALLVDRDPSQQSLVHVSLRSTPCYILVLFLGGADAREALSFADRMVGGANVSLTLVRFLSHNEIGDDTLEKKLDDGMVTSFWVKNEMKEKVAYREVIVENGEETVSAIRALSSDEFNLLIMGRKNGINPVLLQGLSNWSEKHELGIIGDYIVSSDVCCKASIVVFQQQVLRG